MNQTTENVFPKLLETVRNLYEETAALDETDSELQLWYNRGYADGMVSSMKRLGYDKDLCELIDPQTESLVAENRFLPWGKAYQHGFEMGEKESSEVLEEKN